MREILTENCVCRNYLVKKMLLVKTTNLFTIWEFKVFSLIWRKAFLFFSVVCLVAWPLNKREAEGDLVLKELNLTVFLM